MAVREAQEQGRGAVPVLRRIATQPRAVAARALQGSVAEDGTAQDVLRRALLVVIGVAAVTVPLGGPAGGHLGVTLAGEAVLLSIGVALWRRLASPLTVMRLATAGTVAVMTFGLHASTDAIAAGAVVPLDMRLLAYGVIVSGLALLVLRPWRGAVLSLAVQAGWMGLVLAAPAARAQLVESGQVLVLTRYNLIVLVLLWGMVRTTTLLRDERDRLREAAVQARAADQRRQVGEQRRARVLAEAAHELRGPLSTVALGAETLRDQEGELDGPGRRRVTDALHHAAQLLDQRTVELLDAARDRAVARLERQVVDPVVEVARSLEHLDLLTSSHDVRLHGAPGHEARLDPEGLDHILANLVHNATKYAPAGTPIDVTVRRCGSTTVLVVADRGPGVPADLRDELFTPYARSSAHGDIDGSGVGLAVAQSWAWRHGGDARLLETDEGAAFEVVLPDGGVAATADGRAAPTAQ